MTTNQVLSVVANVVLTVVGLGNLGIGTYAAWHGDTTLTLTCLAAGLVLVFAGTIDRFESLKGLGVEAKTRKLDEKLHEADETLRRLRETAEITFGALLDIASKTGRIGTTPTARDSFQLASRVRRVMESLGCSPAAVRTTLVPWARTMCFDMAFVQVQSLRELLDDQARALQIERQQFAHTDPRYAECSSRMAFLGRFQEQRLRGLHRLRLEDYPDRFLEIYDLAPYLEESAVAPLRAEAQRASPGMQALRDDCSLVEAEYWIEVLDRSRE